MKRPGDLKITIITACKNSKNFLTETIESVINQSYKNIEYLIIDGNSSDGSVEIIQRYAEKVVWLSEADSGMYDAINKGLQLATGDYILILNSDDVLANNDTIKNVVVEICTGYLDYYYGNMIKSNKGKSKKVKLFQVTFHQLLLSTHGTFVPHPCFFISTGTNKALGGYDLKYRYASDYDYILRALAVTGNNGKYIDTDITDFRLHENSITASGKIDSERKKILLKHGYYKHSFLKRVFSYYTLWIYYKLINLGNSYKAG